MKIVLAVTNDLVSDQRMNKVANSLIKFGCDVTLVGRCLKNSMPVNPRNYKTKRIFLLFTTGPLFYAEYNLRLFLFLFFSQFDVYVANDLDTLPACYFASILRRKKLVYDSHEYFTEVPELIGRSFARNAWLSIEKFILPRLSFSYTVCQSIADEYKIKYGVTMQVVRNIPAINLSYKLKDLSFPFSNIILYQGALNVGRGIEHIIEAMQFINDAHFLIVGDGDISQQLKTLTAQLQLQNKVTFTGKIPLEELINYTKLATVGISLQDDTGLSYRYVLPNRLFDYIHAGVPVLASALPEMSIILNAYNIGVLAENHNPTYLAEKLNFILNDTESRKIWKENLIFAKRDLCWENEEQKLESIYKSVEL